MVEGSTRNCRCVCSPNEFDESNVDISIKDVGDLYNIADMYNLDQIAITTTMRTTTTTQAPVPVVIVTQPTTTAKTQTAPIDSEFDTCQRQFQTASLNTHNKYRYLHHVPALRSDSALQAFALKYAQIMAANNVFEHSGAAGLGENLAYVWSSRVRTLDDCGAFGERFTKMWYDEISLYDYNRPGFYHETGHFTQLIWKDTKAVGCGLAISRDFKIYGACNYSPPGNFVGAKNFRDNVLPL